MNNGYLLLGSLQKESGEMSRIGRSIETESRLVVARVWGEGRMGTGC